MGGAHGMTEDETLMYTMRMMFAALEVRQVGHQSPKYQLCSYPLPLFSQKLTRPLRLYSTIFRFEIKGAASRHFHCERENTIEQPKGLTPIIRWNSNRMRAMRGSEVSVPRSGTCGKNGVKASGSMSCAISGCHVFPKRSTEFVEICGVRHSCCIRLGWTCAWFLLEKPLTWIPQWHKKEPKPQAPKNHKTFKDSCFVPLSIPPGHQKNCL